MKNQSYGKAIPTKTVWSYSVTTIVQAAMIAALYVVLTFIANALGLANYAIQVRFSEALTILPYFTPAAIPGLFIGCLLSNILTGCAIPDIIFGSIATLIGAVFTYKLRKFKWLAPIPPIISNMITRLFLENFFCPMQCHLVNGTGRREEHKMLRHHAFARVP